ncbi:peptidoglycan recognition protein family protein [Nonomuraea indica]|uniref:peptidoglycan recognition protein family protein n=1 Tax=Nonomuraea indica TaxID=1581193 RepID=UPI000C7CAC5D|nr:peptidoglycan recognition family protein [Nonomuraea indica]
MQLVRRAAFGWGASAASYAHPTRGLVIHYDGSDQGLARREHAACVDYWRRTRRFHMGANRGWSDIGYSYGACPHGYLFEGRGLDRMQAAQPTGNSTYYSVTLMCGPSEDPTPAQIDAVRELRAWLMDKGVGGLVKGHRDFYSTSCPGDRLYRLVKNGTFTKPASGDAKPAAGAKQQEDDDVSAKDVWGYEIPVEWGSKENPSWQAKSILVNAGQRLRNIEAKLDAQHATIKALADALAARDGSVDVDALMARIRSEIESVTVRLDVGE